MRDEEFLLKIYKLNDSARKEAKLAKDAVDKKNERYNLLVSAHSLLNRQQPLLLMWYATNGNKIDCDEDVRRVVMKIDLSLEMLNEVYPSEKSKKLKENIEALLVMFELIK